jgi:hypothetical protein
MKAVTSIILEEPMLSFELSAIDLILALAVIVLLVLYITRSSAKPPAEKKILLEKESPPEKLEEEAAIPEEERKKLVSPQLQPQTGSASCPFGFGYLRKLDKEASIPDGCLSCSRIVECYSANR